MTASSDLAAEVGRLETLDLEALRALWRQRGGGRLSLRSPELMRLLLAWRLQAAAEGGLDPETRRRLRLRGRVQPEGLELGVGARLRREWRGRTVEVVVEEDGFRWEERLYPSLSAAATAIAGTRWNGPRFFGLQAARAMTRPVRRCALYTRKSSEEGLEQDFNSLDAQRAACAAYVKSQASEGWRALETRYDDGGFSGGSMERPALKRLLGDIAAGKVDVVVVYKIDRLTRALADFVRIVERFDQHEVSFVSVTQAFNTTSSMGRLTLNVLLSFAQFEREVTGERIRDKIAASKARGMWMGGTLPFGYDLPAEGRRALRVNPEEAATVRLIFATYLELGSVSALERWLEEQGIGTRQRTTGSGRRTGGGRFNRGALFYLLRNRTYLGMIVHRTKVYPGMHPAIVEPELFEAVQTQLAANRQQRAVRRDRVARAPLTGRIFDVDGQPMSPSFSYGRRRNLYRYYVSAPLLQGRRRREDDPSIRRVPAPALEAMLTGVLRRLAPAASDPLDLLTRVEIHATSVQLLLPAALAHGLRNRLHGDETLATDPGDASQLRLVLPIRMRPHGGRTWIIGGGDAPPRPDPVLIRALRAAHAMLEHDAAGEPVIEAIPASPYHRRLLRLAFLAPDLQRAILAGRQPPGLTLKHLLEQRPPLLWSEQSQGFPSSDIGVIAG